MSKETEEQNVDRVYTRTSLPINEELYWLQQPVIIITEDDDSSFDNLLSQFNISYSNPRNNFAESKSWSSSQLLTNSPGSASGRKTSIAPASPACPKIAVRAEKFAFSHSPAPK